MLNLCKKKKKSKQKTKVSRSEFLILKHRAPEIIFRNT